MLRSGKDYFPIPKVEVITFFVFRTSAKSSTFDFGPCSNESKMATSTKSFIACQQVFSATELLETILERVDARTLLKVQSVSPTFNNLINTSPQLRSELFLDADPKYFPRSQHFFHAVTGLPIKNQLFVPRRTASTCHEWVTIKDVPPFRSS